MKTDNILLSLLFFGCILWLFRSWFLTPDIIGGDWPYLYPSMLKDYSGFVQLWSAQVGRGFGGVNVNQSLYSYLHTTILVANTFNIPWQLVYKIFWYGLFLFLSFFSSLLLLKRLVGKSIPLLGLCVGAFFYTTNTYILMVVAGGQMGIALAYAVLPLVINRFFSSLEALSKLQKKIDYRVIMWESIAFGLSYSLLAFFDIRIAYVTAVVLGLLTIYYYFVISRFSLRYLFIVGIVSLVVFISLHIYWIFPLLFYAGNAIPQEIRSAKSFSFFSFADFSHAFSLIHPNWPENIFGKTSFLRPEFLLLPLVGFSGLLFIQRDKKKKFFYSVFLFFCLIVLLATFFAKGTKDPFSFVNMMVFERVPGMSIFRDSTKFYFFTALSFTFLIPASISMAYDYISKRKKLPNNSLRVIYLIFFIVWLMLLWPFVSGNVSGTFERKNIPEQYAYLDTLINDNPEFFRTLWVPEQSRFRVQSELHPLLIASAFFQTTDKKKILARLVNADKELSDIGIRYVIVPYDPTGEVFVKDRKYSESLRKEYMRGLDEISWLKKIYDNKLTIYENTSYKEHAYIKDSGDIRLVRKDNATYTMALNSPKPQYIYFIEEYSPYWSATLDNKTQLAVQKTKNGTMRVLIPKGLSRVDFVYTPQAIYRSLQIVSVTFLIVFLGMFFWLKNTAKKS